MKIVITSGGFDPLHVGHIELFNKAREIGNYLYVILNNDQFLLKKKGYVFMPLKERKSVLEAILNVDEVVISIDKDMTVNKSLELVSKKIAKEISGTPYELIFLKSADRKGNSEKATCKRLGIKIMYSGKKIQSSSNLVSNVCKKYYATKMRGLDG